MAYDNPKTCMYNFASMDFGATAGNTVHRISGPTGYTGYLREIGVCLSEATVFATTLGKVQVGTSSSATAYGTLNIATAQSANTTFNSGDDTDAVTTATIPADTCVLVTLVEGTGAGLAGTGNPYVIIDWYK